MFRKPVAAWGTLVFIGLVFVAWRSLGLPHWPFLVTGAVALVALLVAMGRARRGSRCPKCLTYAGHAYAARMSRGIAMRPKGDKTPVHLWLKAHPATGWSETSYRCGACANEWQERRDY